MYLINTGNVIQALDAKTGELIWEEHSGAENGGDMRSIAIYDDKIIQVTTDARLVALDARTGKPVWESEIAPRGQGYSSSTGPIVADGKVLTGLGGCARYSEPGCWVSAFDAKTGKLLWKFDTIAQPGSRAATRGESRHLPRRRNLGRSPATIPSSGSPTGVWRRRSRGCRSAATCRSSTRGCIQSTIAVRSPTASWPGIPARPR
jgi:alcohol dehydrogenase (cytochrome c)